MAYDYSSESQRLELPNPYRLDNLFQFAVSAFLLLCALLALLTARANLDGMSRKFVVPLLIGVVLIAYSFRCAAVGMQRLRFFFGRGLPQGLAPELPNGVVGTSKDIDRIKDDLRRGALSFPEPSGAINGLLYHRIPRLILAPQPIQALAQAQFRNALVIALTLLSLLVAWIGFSRPQTAQWVGLFYFGFSASLLLRPLRTDGRTQLGETGVIALVVAALLGPVLVSLVADRLPALPWLTLHWQAFWLLLFALISVTLFFQALVRQLADVSPTNTSCEVSRLNMNTHPAQIIGEFDRVMQEKWADKIPNRRYTRIDPEVDSSTPTGSFQGEMFEETQPMPAHALQSLSLGAALADTRCRWLVYLNSFGSLLLAAAAVALLLFIRRFEADDVDLSAGQFITFAFVAFSVGRFCFEASAQLWGRFDFVSEIIWLELSGQYTTAHNRLGNDFTSTVRSESHGIHVDAMTMRVWTARIESVVFGKTARRHVIAMHGQSEVTSGLSAHLASFARERSMFVAPTNADDMHKLGAVQSAPAAAAQLAARLQDQLAASTPGAVAANDVGAAAASDRFCAACGAVRQPAARFCGACGSKFNP